MPNKRWDIKILYKGERIKAPDPSPVGVEGAKIISFPIEHAVNYIRKKYPYFPFKVMRVYKKGRDHYVELWYIPLPGKGWKKDVFYVKYIYDIEALYKVIKKLPETYYKAVEELGIDPKFIVIPHHLGNEVDVSYYEKIQDEINIDANQPTKVEYIEAIPWSPERLNRIHYYYIHVMYYNCKTKRYELAKFKRFPHEMKGGVGGSIRYSVDRTSTCVYLPGTKYPPLPLDYDGIRAGVKKTTVQEVSESEVHPPVITHAMIDEYTKKVQSWLPQILSDIRQQYPKLEFSLAYKKYDSAYNKFVLTGSARIPGGYGVSKYIYIQFKGDLTYEDAKKQVLAAFSSVIERYKTSQDMKQRILQQFEDYHKKHPEFEYQISSQYFYSTGFVLSVKYRVKGVDGWSTRTLTNYTDIKRFFHFVDSRVAILEMKRKKQMMEERAKKIQPWLPQIVSDIKKQYPDLEFNLAYKEYDSLYNRFVLYGSARIPGGYGLGKYLYIPFKDDLTYEDAKKQVLAAFSSVIERYKTNQETKQKILQQFEDYHKKHPKFEYQILSQSFNSNGFVLSIKYRVKGIDDWGTRTLTNDSDIKQFFRYIETRIAALEMKRKNQLAETQLEEYNREIDRVIKEINDHSKYIKIYKIGSAVYEGLNHNKIRVPIQIKIDHPHKHMDLSKWISISSPSYATIKQAFAKEYKQYQSTLPTLPTQPPELAETHEVISHPVQPPPEPTESHEMISHPIKPPIQTVLSTQHGAISEISQTTLTTQEGESKSSLTPTLIAVAAVIGLVFLLK